MSRIEKGLKAAARTWIESLDSIASMDDVVKTLVNDDLKWFRLDTFTAVLLNYGHLVKAVYVPNGLQPIRLYVYQGIDVLPTALRARTANLFEKEPSRLAYALHEFNDFVQTESKPSLSLKLQLSPTDKATASDSESAVINSTNFVQVVDTQGAYTLCALDDKGVVWGLVAPAGGITPYWERLPEPNEDRQSEEVQQALRKGFLNWMRTLYNANTTRLPGVWYLTIQSPVMVECKLGNECFVIEGVYLNGRGVDNRVSTFNNTLTFIPEGYCRIRAIVNNTPIWIDSLDGFRSFLAGVQDRIFAN